MVTMPKHAKKIRVQTTAVLFARRLPLAGRERHASAPRASATPSATFMPRRLPQRYATSAREMQRQRFSFAAINFASAIADIFAALRFH